MTKTGGGTSVPLLLSKMVLFVLVLASPIFADSEQFISPSLHIGTLELQSEASVYSATITLKQICRWSREDDVVFRPVADLVLARFNDQAYTSVKAEDILPLLAEAGLSPAAVQFTGSAACTVSHVDAPIDHSAALVQWTQAEDASRAATKPAPMAESEAGPVQPSHHHASENSIVTVEDALTNDLANRLQMPVDSLQIQFDPRDDKILSMTNPPFTVEIAPSRLRILGNVSWDLTIRAGRTMQSVHIAAYARAWQNQVVTTNPIEYNQVLRTSDLTEQRVLVDALTDEPLLTKQQAVGQQASMNLKIGTVMTSGKVAAVPLIRSGQLVTVDVAQGGINIQTEARALESAAFGQSVRLRNEATHDIFEATVTGPQQADVK